jgi:hypothetical protein
VANEKQFILSFSEKEMKDSSIKSLISKLIELKLNLQRYNDFVTISPAEFEIIKKSGEFVDKSKYNNITTFKGEIGKIRGKKLCIL